MSNKQNFYCARFYVTYRCNSRCIYCNVWRKKEFQNIPELELEDAKLLLDQCYAAGIRYIDFTGGEPTLYPHLTELILYAKKLGIKTEVTSNCIALFSKKKMLQVAEVADKFNTSLDTLNQEAYAAIRGVNCCQNVKETILEIAQKRPPKIMTVVTDNNIKELPAMISYAQKLKAMIYLSPMFPYLDKNGIYQTSRYTQDIIAQTFTPYTIVLLHFMEFFQNASAEHLPPCSANKYTLTFAPNGDIVLPCYHAFAEKISWNKNLAAALASPLFAQYQKLSGAMKTCKGCSVIPYFGISFNYQLNKYFLLQSYSEKLYHLKRDVLNSLLLENNPDNTKLYAELDKLIELTRSLVYKPDIAAYKTKPEDTLYPVQIMEDKVYSPVYKHPLSAKQYQEEQQATDCWQLTLVPHHYFDKLCSKVIIPLAQKITTDKTATEIILQILEFQIRWWRFYIGAYMKLSKEYDITADNLWLKNYLTRLSQTFQEADKAVLNEGLMILQTD